MIRSIVFIRALMVGVVCLLSGAATHAQQNWRADCTCTSNLTVTVDICIAGQGTFSADVDLCVTNGVGLPGPCVPDPPLPQGPPFSNYIIFAKTVCWNDGAPTATPTQIYHALLCAFIDEVCTTPNQWGMVVPIAPASLVVTWKFPSCVQEDGDGCLTVCEQNPCGAHDVGIGLNRQNGVCTYWYMGACGTHVNCVGACEHYDWTTPDLSNCPCM